MAADEAEVDDVPDQTHFSVKNTATLALQLIKRFRNIRYADYSGRIPPSVVLSYYAALAARPNMRLSEMVIRIAKWILRDIEAASMSGRRLHVANPMCPNDIFTDRWPESVAQQNEFANHLKDIVNGLEFDGQDDDGCRRHRRVVAPHVRRPRRHQGGGQHRHPPWRRHSEHAAELFTQGTPTRAGTGRSLSAAVAPLVAPATRHRAHTFYGVRL